MVSIQRRASIRLNRWLGVGGNVGPRSLLVACEALCSSGRKRWLLCCCSRRLVCMQCEQVATWYGHRGVSDAPFAATPNPSIERAAYDLRPPAAPHVER